jgi:hypothetical protein
MKILVAKLSIFLLITLVIQGVWTFLAPPKTPQQIRFLNKYLADKTDIIYFGDSSIHHYSQLDDNEDSMPTILQQKLPNYKVGRVSAAAYNMDLYVEFVKYIVANDFHPQFIIIPISLRSFSPEWDMRPAYQFEQEKLFLKLAHNNFTFPFYRPLATLTDLRPISDADFANTTVYNGQVPVGKVEDFEGSDYSTPSVQKIKNKIIFHYMYSLTKEHRKVQSMLELADVLKASDIKVIFYITPVDYQTGEKFLEAEFRARVAQNTTLLKSLLAEKGIDVLDLTFNVDASLFNWGLYPKDGFLYPNEHLQYEGRKYVAEQLYKRLQQDFANPSTTTALQSEQN